MQLYFLDNYRGFSNTVLRLEDVNFCVGENSTGKTSFLNLVHLLQSTRFWLEPPQEGMDALFGHFDDQVSISAEDRGFFRIGFARSFAPKRSVAVAKPQAFLFSFKEYEGTARLRNCTYLNRDGSVVRVQLTRKTVRYRAADSNTAPTLASFEQGLFSQWAKEHEGSFDSGYSVLKDTVGLDLTQAPLFFIFASLEHQRARSGEISSFQSPNIMMPGNDEFTWIAPIRSKPRRTYDKSRSDFSPEGEHTPYVIRKILGGGKRSRKFGEFIRDFGRESGLFKDVKIHRFGKLASSPFELEVVLDEAPLNIENVGYGVSQGLPVIVEAFVRPRSSWFAIQQPEVHLHPRAQAAIGEIFYHLANVEDKKFVIETHSDFMIDRFRLCRRADKDSSIGCQILFFERQGGKNLAHRMVIDPKGELPRSQPKSYREFFLREQLRLLDA